MSETWIPWAIKRPGPPQKVGYGGVSVRPLFEIEGEVKHSTEGSLEAAFGELDKLTRMASWHFTIDWDGTLYQHYPLESICWHCGLPGDRRQDTSLIGNLTLVGIEHVDRKDGIPYPVLMSPQIVTTTRVTDFVRDNCVRVAANPPTLKLNLWEHRELSATACPSGLIPWQQIITGLAEDDMPDEVDVTQSQQIAELKEENRIQSEQIVALQTALAAHLDSPHEGDHKHTTGPPE